MFKTIDRRSKRKRIHGRLRKRLTGTAERPRLNVFRSHKNLYFQLIDDLEGKTLTSFSTLKESFRKANSKGGNLKAARELGILAGKEMKAAGINKIVFDRGGYHYHGRVMALADGLREGGIEF